MSDDLHVPNADLVVWHNGKEHMMLNKSLLDQQNCWENLEWIKELHGLRLVLEGQLAEEATPEGLGEWTDIQLLLQEAWGFPVDDKFHRFWDMKGCLCPKMDNNDAYPAGHYVISSDCPVHNIRRPDETTTERSE